MLWLSLDALLHERHSLCLWRRVAFETLNDQQKGSANPGHSKLWSLQILNPEWVSLLKWLADDNDFSGTICCLCDHHWQNALDVFYMSGLCMVYMFLNKRKTGRKINCRAWMRLGRGLSSSFMGRILKSVRHLFCQGGHLCSSIITSYLDTVDLFSICSA